MSVGAGTTEYTVKSIMDRLFQTYLTPPDNQYAQVVLAQDMDASVEEVRIGDFTIPEDEELLRQGSILEADQELMRVVSYDATSGSVGVTRGEYGTVPVSHSQPLLLNLNPPYTRAAVFEAVADNIITLYPSLFTTSQTFVPDISGGVYPINDELAVEVLTAWGEGWSGTTNIHTEVVDFHQLAGGRAFITNHPNVGALWFRYRRRMAKAESEADTLVDLGMDERWVTIVMVGAAADLLVGRDIPAARTEWVESVLESANIRVGTRMSIAGGLRQYHGMLLDAFSKEMKAEYRPKMRMRSPIKQIV